jgi:hypothetical protein
MRLLLTVVLATFSLFVAPPAAALDMDACPHDATLSSLRACVEHAMEIGAIDDAGVAVSLLAKIDAAQAALDRQQLAVAATTLTALARELAAQAGKHIAEPHAGHLQEHVQHVIAALTGAMVAV